MAEDLPQKDRRLDPAFGCGKQRLVHVDTVLFQEQHNGAAAEQKAADAAVCMVTDGPDLAMNRYNTPKKKKKKKKEKPAAESGQGSPEQVAPEPVTPEQDTPEQGTLEQDNLDHPSEKQDKTV